MGLKISFFLFFFSFSVWALSPPPPPTLHWPPWSWQIGIKAIGIQVALSLALIFARTRWNKVALMTSGLFTMISIAVLLLFLEEEWNNGPRALSAYKPYLLRNEYNAHLFSNLMVFVLPTAIFGSITLKSWLASKTQGKLARK